MFGEPNRFSEIWLVDFEFHAPPGERQTPICLVALELLSGRKLSYWADELERMAAPPYRVDGSTLFVAYYASAELGCHRALGWDLPVNVLDLFAEFRCITNGRALQNGRGLLGALFHFGLDGIASLDKERMRALASRGGPWSHDEMKSLLDYCESDVLALHQLMKAMAATIDLDRALIRGRYMKAAALIEQQGIPIDVGTLRRIQNGWDGVRERLIAEVDSYGVFQRGSFRIEKWEAWLNQHDISWPRLPSGQLRLDDETFKDMAIAFPAVAPIRELRLTLDKLRSFKLPVGTDGRNRFLLSVFSSKTGRNQPRAREFSFALPSWMRGLIQPPPGHGLAYIDWSQQEFGIAAALSGDAAMMAAYASGDPYLTFAKQVGAIPESGTKASHAAIRDQFKAVTLAVQYSMGAESLAQRIHVSVARARDLLALHRRAYSTFWQWSDASVDHAMLGNELHTTFGWSIAVEVGANPRSLRNFPMQANGAEMMRIACMLATENGVRVCAPVHDALLVEAPLSEIDDAIERARVAMAKASAIVLDGFVLRSEVKVMLHPDRILSEKGLSMWNLVMRFIQEEEERSRRDGAVKVIS